MLLIRWLALESFICVPVGKPKNNLLHIFRILKVYFFFFYRIFSFISTAFRLNATCRCRTYYLCVLSKQIKQHDMMLALESERVEEKIRKIERKNTLVGDLFLQSSYRHRIYQDIHLYTRRGPHLKRQYTELTSTSLAT